MLSSGAMKDNDDRVDFVKDGFNVRQAVIDSKVIEEWNEFYQKLSTHIFEDLYENGHTDFPEDERIDSNGVTKYSLGKGVKNGFREIVMRSGGRYEISIINNERVAPPSIEGLKASLYFCLSFLGAKSWSDVKICNMSFVTSRPGSTDQTWHADGGHLSLDEHLQCHCMNIFIPLLDITKEMGPTELRPESQYLTRNLAPMMLAARCRKTLRTPVAPLLKASDVLIFDYRILHRGLANTSDQDRVFLVLTLSKPFFNDLLNFPSRSLYNREV